MDSFTDMNYHSVNSRILMKVKLRLSLFSHISLDVVVKLRLCILCWNWTHFITRNGEDYKLPLCKNEWGMHKFWLCTQGRLQQRWPRRWRPREVVIHLNRLAKTFSCCVFSSKKHYSLWKAQWYSQATYYKVKKRFKNSSFAVVLKNLFAMELGTFPPVPQLDINLHFFLPCVTNLRYFQTEF